MDDKATLEELCEGDVLVMSPMREDEEDESIQVSFLRTKKTSGTLLILRLTVGFILLTSFLTTIIYQDIEKGNGITHPWFFGTLVSLDIVLLAVLVLQICIYRSCCPLKVTPESVTVNSISLSVTLEEDILNL